MTASHVDEQMRRTARAIFISCMGSTPRRILAQAGGLTNFVFRIDSVDGSFGLRMSPDEHKLEDYRKEWWAIRCARQANMPAPEVLHVSRTSAGVSFTLLHRTPGRPATARRVDTLEVLRRLGQYAQVLHATKLPAFGGRFAENEPPRLRWAEFLEHEFRLDERIGHLRALGFLDEGEARRVAVLMETLGADREPRLNHGDLRLKNVLIDPAGYINAVIDWECAVAAPAPEWDPAVALHDLSIDEKDAFIDGYGLDGEALTSLGPALAALNVLHNAPFAAAAARDGNDEQLRRYRRRFARVYDLYSVD